MAFIDEVVDVQITRDSIGLSLVALDTLLIIGETKNNVDYRIKNYGSLSEVKNDYAIDTPEYKAAALAFGQEIRPTKLLIGQKIEADGNYGATYNAIKDINNDFYGVVILSKVEADILAVATAVEADEKLFGVSTDADTAITSNDTTSIMKKLFDLKRLCTFVMYSKGQEGSENDKIEAGLMGLMLSKPAGSATWAYKTISGVTANNLNTQARSIIEAKNGNYYINVAQVSKTYNGKTAGGEWIDVISGLAWLKNNLKISVFNAISTIDKVPYTNDGIAIIESAVRGVLQQSVDRGILDAEGIIVTVPDIRNIPQTTRAQRILPDVKFEARLAGAIHIVNVSGTVSV